MKNKTKHILNLQLFSEAGTEVTDSKTGENSIADAEQENENLNNQDEFENLIDGKFKDEFRKRTQSIIDKRFKETKLLEEYKAKVSPIIEKLNQQHGIEDGNLDTLYDKLFQESQNTSQSEEANLILKSRVASWVKESESLKEIYPDFDFREELKSQSLFGKLLHSGVPLKSAYEVVHKDEILSGAMAYTAQKVREQVVKGIEAKGRRPLENGVASESGIVTVTDVNALTSKDILKILKQVEKGVSVKF